MNFCLNRHCCLCHPLMVQRPCLRNKLAVWAFSKQRTFAHNAERTITPNRSERRPQHGLPGESNAVAIAHRAGQGETRLGKRLWRLWGVTSIEPELEEFSLAMTRCMSLKRSRGLVDLQLKRIRKPTEPPGVPICAGSGSIWRPDRPIGFRLVPSPQSYFIVLQICLPTMSLPAL